MNDKYRTLIGPNPRKTYKLPTFYLCFREKIGLIWSSTSFPEEQRINNSLTARYEWSDYRIKDPGLDVILIEPTIVRNTHLDIHVSSEPMILR